MTADLLDRAYAPALPVPPARGTTQCWCGRAACWEHIDYCDRCLRIMARAQLKPRTIEGSPVLVCVDWRSCKRVRELAA